MKCEDIFAGQVDKVLADYKTYCGCGSCSLSSFFLAHVHECCFACYLREPLVLLVSPQGARLGGLYKGEGIADQVCDISVIFPAIFGQYLPSVILVCVYDHMVEMWAGQETTGWVGLGRVRTQDSDLLFGHM